MSEPKGTRTGLIVAVLVILGLTAGLGLGLLLGWVVFPVKYVDTAITDLRADHKEEYILLVASSYVCDQDLEKAQARLEVLEAPNIGQWLAEMVDRCISEGCDEADITALATLAHGLGVESPQMIAYLASPTPTPTDTPLPTPTAAPTDVPTVTPIPPTAEPAATETPLAPTDTPVPPTDTPQPQQPTATPVPPSPTPVPPTDTPVPPTNTPVPPTNTSAPPPPTNTPKPQPTNTPKPPPAAGWSNQARLVGPGEDGQGCTYGNLQIRVTVVDAGGNQLSGIWVYDKYSQIYQVTGNVGSPEWGPGETKFEYGVGGGGSLCIASGEGGGCVSSFTRDMPVYFLPPFEDMWAVGYCACEKPDISREECQRMYNEGTFMQPGAGHFSWRVVFKRNS